QHQRKIWVLFLSFPIVSLVGIGLGLGSERLKDIGWIGESFMLCIAFSGVLLLFAWMIRSGLDLFRILPEGLVCPRCRSRHYAADVAKLGGCGWCGQRLIADSPMESDPVGVAAESPPG